MIVQRLKVAFDVRGAIKSGESKVVDNGPGSWTVKL